MTTPRYTIRPTGRAAWGNTDDKHEAVRLYREAQNRLGREESILIYDETEQCEVYPDDLVPPQRPDYS